MFPLRLLLCLLLAAPLQAQKNRVVGVGGVHVGGPVRASVAAGALVRVGRWGDSEQGVLVLVEPGWRGDRLSVGYAAIAQLGTILSARASFLRMRRDPAPTGYVGLELQYAPLLVVGARVGAFTPLRRDRGQRPTLLANFSLGF